MNVTTTTLFERFANGPRPPIEHDIFGVPTFFLWNLLFMLVLALVMYWLLRGTRHPPETPMDLLKKRYVRGELTKEQYEEMKKDLSE